MKFIVEEELRGQYKRAPFSNFTLTEDTRLTPEARQFLIDKKIKIEAKESFKEKQLESINTDSSILNIKIKKTLSTFWLVNSLTLEKNKRVANKLMELAVYFEQSYQCFKEGKRLPDLTFLEQKEIDDKHNKDLMTTLFIQSISGQEIVFLNYLNCSISEMQIEIEREDTSTQGESLCRNFELINLQISSLIEEVLESYG